MSSRKVIVHSVREGETLDSLVQKYRLPSRVAILDLGKNDAIRTKLSGDGALSVGLIVHIPPDAGRLIQERMFALNEIKPVLLSHFDTLQELAGGELYPALSDDSPDYGSVEVSNALQNLGEFVSESIDKLTGYSRELAELGTAVSLTHVATPDDHALAAESHHETAGLGWAVSASGLRRWQTMWSRDLWDQKWLSVSAQKAVRLTDQYMTTVRSIVVQQADQRIRQDLLLQRKLRSE